jgi:isocitrate/isopropylmalate dehydrogenase
MVTEGRAQYADPCSMIRAAAMLLSHIGYVEKGKNLEMALDITGQYEKKMLITGRPTGVTGEVFTDYVMDWVKNPKLQQTWEGYIKG